MKEENKSMDLNEMITTLDSITNYLRYVRILKENERIHAKRIVVNN